MLHLQPPGLPRYEHTRTTPFVDGLHCTARFKIHPGKLDEYKRLAALCMESARSKDTGTLQYDLFLSDDQSEGVVHERYRDSDSLLQHTANLGELMAIIMKVASYTGEICGTPSPALLKALEGSGVGVFKLYQSL
jgi:quinol monooxygenase YgiN